MDRKNRVTKPRRQGPLGGGFDFGLLNIPGVPWVLLFYSAVGLSFFYYMAFHAKKYIEEKNSAEKRERITYFMNPFFWVLFLVITVYHIATQSEWFTLDFVPTLTGSVARIIISILVFLIGMASHIPTVPLLQKNVKYTSNVVVFSLIAIILGIIDANLGQ